MGIYCTIYPIVGNGFFFKCTSSAYFKFESKFYAISDDVPMAERLNVSLVLPNISINALLTMIHKEIEFSTPIFFICRWSNLVASGKNIYNILLFFNNGPQSVQFTCEKETDKSLPFLNFLSYQPLKKN